MHFLIESFEQSTCAEAAILRMRLKWSTCMDETAARLRAGTQVMALLHIEIAMVRMRFSGPPV